MGGACSTYGERRCVCRVLLGKPEGRDYLEELSVGGRIILSWFFRKWDVGYGLDSSGLG
jgi:hypothetical protein